jgi:DHA1 family quinolone resistance protein-like MFS transporter
MNNKLVFIYTLNQTFHWFMVGITIPIFTLLFLEKGLNLFQVGIAIAVQSIVVVVLELPSGGLADSIGRKKVYLISLIISFLSVLSLLFLKGFVAVTTSVIFLGVAQALSSGTIDAWFVDEFNTITPYDNLQEALAKAQIFIPVGVGLSALVGGILPMTLGKFTSLIPGFGIYSANLIFKIFLIAAQFIMTSLMIQEHIDSERKSNFIDGFKAVPDVLKKSVEYGLKKRMVFILLLTQLAWGFAFVGLESFWQPQVKNIVGSGMKTWILGALNAGYFFAGSIGSMLITPICRRLKNNFGLLLFSSRLLLGIFFFLLAMQANIMRFSVFYLTLFIFNGMANPLYLTVFNKSIPEKHRSTLLSLDSLFMKTGVFIGGIIIGYLANRFSISLGWFVGGGILTASSILFLKLPLNFEAIIANNED